MKHTGIALVAAAGLLVASLAGCANSAATQASTTAASTQEVAESLAVATASQEDAAPSGASDGSAESVTAATESTTAIATVASAEAANSALDTSAMFTERDLAQSADVSGATSIILQSGQDVTIGEEGVYAISGNATEATIVVDADSSEKVQLVLDGVSITNTSAPAIYVKSADKVFVTLVGDNSLATSGAFAANAEDNVDAVIFSKDDLVFNGTGSLSISSSDNGIAGKDDVKIAGGAYTIVANNHAIEANDSIRIADGTFSITAGKDGLHSDNDADDTLGYLYVAGGTFSISAGSDGAEATSVAQIDGGTFSISSGEGIEATYVQINGGTIDIAASDDGINASASSSAYEPTIEINGGTITVVMAQGDTDALDSNGSIFVNGGTVDITAQFAFDFDRTAELNGGTVYVNGQQVTQITNSMMGGGMGGAGAMGGRQGFGGGRFAG